MVNEKLTLEDAPLVQSKKIILSIRSNAVAIIVSLQTAWPFLWIRLRTSPELWSQRIFLILDWLPTMARGSSLLMVVAKKRCIPAFPKDKWAKGNLTNLIVIRTCLTDFSFRSASHDTTCAYSKRLQINSLHFSFEFPFAI